MRVAAQETGCAHCGAAVPAGARFCCTGCDAAHGLVAGLGLDAFYRRREGADGSLRPAVDAPAMDFTLHVRGEGEEKTLELMVAGLTCGACVWLVEQALAAEPDVTRARLALSTRRLTLSWRGEAARANAFVALLARLGFRTAPWSPACLRATEDAEGRQLVRALGIAAFGAMNVMMLSVAVWVGWDMGEATRAAMHWAAAVIGLPTVLVAGLPIYRGALAGLRQGRLNMDMAVTLGVLATTAMSASETLRNGDYTYFDAATTLLALLLAGRVLDRAARRRARQAVAELLALQEGAVTRLDADGTAHAAPAANIRAGDRILVAAGERLRLDAVLEAGEALLDASATNGETLPRGFVAGEALPAGAVNMGAPFVARVTAAAADGSLAAMARLLERAEQAKGRFVDVADRVVRVFVPVVHAVAALTFLFWWLGMGVGWQAALVPAVAALIVTCPCGFAIAVPAVQAVAVGALFRRGVLVANGTALERLASADHAVLDKTGTLTEGRPTLLPGDWTEAALREAAGMARASRHPLARALAMACPDAPAAEAVREVPGRGLACGERRLGSAAFLGVTGPDAGLTLWYAAPGAAPVAFRFADRLRPEAAVLVRDLGALGLSAELLSGDAPPAVAAVASQAGIAGWTAQATPEDKAARIQALRAEGRRPLMLGDGINDAAALALAHVSACPGDGTDLAQTASDLVLRAEGLAALPAAIRTARRAQRLARQNIGFSLLYNAVAVPLAVLGIVTPLIAAVVMATSSLIVIGNSLRAGKDPAWTA
ncbi:heavy metal translocating P-type ATPase [Paracraurococcus ruber]|uniref:Copper-translocating P-type ATPase n=2 Tax=Paracraurococcus ruber TaxID=77675 RepID=A0ABS1CY92_9PROT|nr:heavy metal translocating P-type ATPase [Paracraurococcus ruber]MBK1659395.1 copper-translocating P-type ATPase [Paracraurococcus ruber]TDG30505.1 heavy metal translocating P-type ATPase [Paracraurococcus ruber]